jgi:hypothetical protein
MVTTPHPILECSTWQEVATYLEQRYRGTLAPQNDTFDFAAETADIIARGQRMPEWRRRLYDVVRSRTEPSLSLKTRLRQAIALSVLDGINIPRHLRAAEGDALKREETRFYEAQARMQMPLLDEHRTYDANLFAIALINGRYDVAAQMFFAASSAKKRRWVAKRKL